MRRLIDRRLLKYVALIVSFCWLLSIPNVQGQDKCDPEATLTQATDEFNAGHFFGLPDLLRPCLSTNNFTKEQLVRANQLLTQTYLILEDAKGAEESYLNLLKANPEYVSNPDRDPIDVVYLSKKFTATPIFSWYATGAGNVTMPRVITKHTVFPGSRQSYTIRPRWSVGGGIIWNINDQLTTEVGLNFVSTSFGYYQDQIFIFDNLTVNESQLSLLTPLSLKYTLVRRRGVSPYGYAGVSANILLAANQDFLFVNKTPTYNGNDIIAFADQTTEAEQNVRFRREFLSKSFHIGTGFRWKYKLDYLFVDIRYSFGLDNSVKREGLIRDNQEPMSDMPTFSIGHVDNYFRIDQAFISVGYIKPLYKPRKLKNTRSRGVLRDVKKADNE